MNDFVIPAEDLSYGIVDKYCLDLFPELKTFASREDMVLASTTGTYNFHEGYFMEFIEQNRKDKKIIQRFCNYIEYLLSDENHHLNHLAEVGLLEGCLSIGLHEMRPFVGPKTLDVLKELSKHFTIDRRPWDI